MAKVITPEIVKALFVGFAKNFKIYYTTDNENKDS